MRAHVAALKAALAPLGYPVPYGDATGLDEFPYLLLWSSAGTPGAERTLDDAHTDLDELFGITSVASSPENVLTVAWRVREALTPGGRPGTLQVAGRAVWIRLEDSRPVAVDRDVTMPGTNRHPAFGVDMYRLTSTPA